MPRRGRGMMSFLMATRIGIELSPDACRIVEIDPAAAWERRRGETRVRSFAVLPRSGPETDAKLRSLRKRRAAVVVWNTASDHRQVMVSPGSYESMRAEAIGALDAAGVETRGVWVDIAPAGRTADRAARRPVVVTLASGSELTAALQPLRGRRHSRADGDDAGRRAQLAGAAAARLLDAGRIGGVRRARRTGDVHRAHARRRADRVARSGVGIRRRARLGSRAAGPRGHRGPARGGDQRFRRRDWRCAGRHQTCLRVRRSSRVAQHDGAVDGAARRRVRAARFAVRDRCGAAARAGRRVSRAWRRVEASRGRRPQTRRRRSTCSARATARCRRPCWRARRS